MTKRGLFITFEGTEGSGKTTQVKLLAERLQNAGQRVTVNQEPGGTAIGKQIRRILLSPENDHMAGITELLLMFASRAQAAAEVITPALDRGEIVLSDRFTDSSLAYQGAGRGIGFEKVREAHKLALGSLMPELTIFVSVDLEAGLERAHKRNAEDIAEARLDQQELEFHRRVRNGYDRIAREEPERFRLIDGSGGVEEVAARIWEVVKSHVV